MKPEELQPLFPVHQCLKQLGHKNIRGSNIDGLIRHHKINVLAEIAFGRGTMRMMTKQQADDILRQHHAREPVDAAPSDEVDLHVGAIEIKLDRLDLEIKGNTQAVNELLKATNLLVMRLNKVLEQLGCPTSSL